MGFYPKSILSIGIVAWMFISCTENKSNTDSSMVTNESEVRDSVSNELLSDSIVTDTTNSLTQKNTADRIENAQQKLRDELGTGNVNENQSTLKYRLDVEPYNYFADQDGYISFKGRTLSEIQHILGDAPIIVKQSIKGAPVRKEVRVYMPYSEDATGLYLFVQNEIVQDFKIDEFNGIQNSSIMEFFESR